jgi:transcriptional regulator with XRE-family HTH domain
MHTGNVIRVMRIETGVTQREVADAWGSSQGLLSLIERGIRVPDEAEVMEIKKAIVSALQRKSVKYADIAQRISA